MFGEVITRLEDLRLVRGQGLFVEDDYPPGMLYATFVRSERAHARIASLDTAAAVAVPGVVAVVTPDTWEELAWQMPMRFGTTGNGDIPYNAETAGAPRTVLGRRVPRVGEPLAMILSDTAASGVDAASLVYPDYEDLPVATWDGVLDGTAPPAHPGYDNEVASMHHTVGNVEEAIANAPVVLDLELHTQSLKSMAIECRGVLSNWDSSSQVMTVRSTNQSPYSLRRAVATMLGLELSQVRVISKDIGGSFGLKGRLAPEELMTALATFKLGVPVRWCETRLEHMLAADQNGRQRHILRVAARENGTLLALDIKIDKEAGAFNHADVLLVTNTVNHLTTHYRVPAIRARARMLATNAAPVSPYRGAGRVEASFCMDRILDALARRTGLDPLEIRRCNIIATQDLPYRNGLIYRDGIPVEYRDTDFPRLLQSAADGLDYWGWRDRQKSLRQEGRHLGIGIASYVEGSGIGPSESARVSLEDEGRVCVSIAVACMGQSHETTIAQVCAKALAVPIEQVSVHGGDTDRMPIGFGTSASRVAVTVGNATHLAAQALLEQMRAISRPLLDCEATDVECGGGFMWARQAPDRRISFKELVEFDRRHPLKDEGTVVGLSATATYQPRTVVWSAGVHMVVVEIDGVTGRPKVLKYVVAHDCGNPINPNVVDGQLMGGFTQGLGIALGEAHRHDEMGQVLTGSLMNYYVPRAEDVPTVEFEHFCFPSTENPLGVKGVGESGVNAPPAALAAAVEDALAAHITIHTLPISWDCILGALARMEEGEENKP